MFLAGVVIRHLLRLAVPPGAPAAIADLAASVVLATLMALALFHIAARTRRSGGLGLLRIRPVRFAESIKGAAFLYVVLLPAVGVAVAGKTLLDLSVGERQLWTAEIAGLGGILVLAAFGFWVLLVQRALFLPALTAASDLGFMEAWRGSRRLVRAMPERLSVLLLKLAALNLPFAAVAAFGGPAGPPALLGLSVTLPVSCIALTEAARSLAALPDDRPSRGRPSFLHGLAAIVLMLSCGAAGGLAIRELGLDAADEREALTSLRLLTADFTDPDPGLTPTASFRPLTGAQIAAHRITGIGTGFFVDREGDMLTNAHAVIRCRMIVTRIGRHVAPVRLVAMDPFADLALLKVAVENTRHVPIPAEQTYRLGQQIFTFGWGNPAEGKVSLDSAGQFQTGLLNAVKGLNDDAAYFQISANLNPGNSGGAIVDAYGMLAGIASLSLAKVGNPTIAFGLKHESIASFLAARKVPYTPARPGAELTAEQIAQIVSPASRRLFCLK